MAPREPKHPPTPRGLSQRAGKLWRAVVREYELSAAELEVLRSACELLDRADAAAKVVKREGVVVVDRYGSPKQHPAADVEARSRATFARLIHQLGVKLAEEEGPATSRARKAAVVRWGRAAVVGERRRSVQRRGRRGQGA